MKQVFGKGLESLIPKKTAKTSKEPAVRKEPIFYIEINRIKSNPYQPRKNFDQDSLKSLADSIKEYGVLQPLLVSRIEKESGAEYQLVAGERRLLASKMIGLTQVPVIVRDPTEKEKLEVSLVENVQRANLNPLEKAEAYKKLCEEFNFMQKDIAKMVGCSREAIANTLRLFDLPEEIKTALREGKITEGHARAMLTATDVEKQRIIFLQTIRDGLNVREVESLAQKMGIWRFVPKQATAAVKELKDLEARLKQALRVKDVRLNMRTGKPKLSVFFNTKEEVEILLERLKS